MPVWIVTKKSTVSFRGKREQVHNIARRVTADSFYIESAGVAVFFNRNDKTASGDYVAAFSDFESIRIEG
jgi:hypothetical protein